MALWTMIWEGFSYLLQAIMLFLKPIAVEAYFSILIAGKVLETDGDSSIEEVTLFFGLFPDV